MPWHKRHQHSSHKQITSKTKINLVVSLRTPLVSTLKLLSGPALWQQDNRWKKKGVASQTRGTLAGCVGELASLLPALQLLDAIIPLHSLAHANF